MKMAICEMKVTSSPLCLFWEHAISSLQVFLRALGRHPFSISSFAMTRQLYSAWNLVLGHTANFSFSFAFYISTLCVLLPSTVWRHGEGTSSPLQLDFSITCKLLISRRYNVDIKLSWLAGEESKRCRYNPVIGKTEHNNCSPYF